MIDRVRIRNFRSIKSVEFKPGALNVIAGPNNAGKSNILRALALVLGPKWPPSAVAVEDKRRGSDGQPLVIQVGFSQPITKDYYGTEYDVHGLKLEWHSPDNSDFVCLDNNGQVIEVGRNLNPLRVDNDLREQVPALYVDAERSLGDELRASQWTLLGKILRRIEADLREDPAFTAEYETQAAQFAEKLRHAMITRFETLLNEEMAAMSGMEQLHLHFGKPQLLDSLTALQILIREAQGFPPTDVSELGHGLQSSLVVALARAYQTLEHVQPVLILEEPEMYLHPHARRAFRNLLEKTSNERDCQVFISTHASEFVDVVKPNEIVLTRKTPSEGTVIVQGNRALLSMGQREELKLAVEMHDRLREVFFAECVIACEGDAEANSIPTLLRIAGFDPDRESVGIVSVGSKSNLPFFLKLLNHFQIRTVAVFDDDSDKATFATYDSVLNTEIETANGGRDRCWVATPDFERQHAIPRVEGSKPRSALLWARSLDEATAQQIVEPLLRAVLSTYQ